MTWTTAKFVSRMQREALSPQPLFETLGRVRRAVGSSLEVSGCEQGLGQRCAIELPTRRITAEIVGFHDGITHVQPFADVTGLQVGARVWPIDTEPRPCLDALLGRVVNGLGEPLDGSPIRTMEDNVYGPPKPINPLQRQPITAQMDLGVRSINALLCVGIGQRIGLFAGSGVGKSVLLGMLARFVKADVVVVALIGERGREVREFIEENLGKGLSRSVVVASPADDSPVLRIRAAFLATEIAECYRAEGKNVLLLMDSLTRIAQAQREVGLAAGEPPTTKGYTPSVFRLMPTLVERAGTSGPDEGAITAIYTVLTEEDDMQEPVADAARSILDGHFVLDRNLAEAGLYPAINIPSSISRLMSKLTDTEHQEAARTFRQLWSRYAQQEDLINVGAYVEGSDPITDRAIRMRVKLEAFLCQDIHTPVSMSESRSQLMDLFLENKLPVVESDGEP